MPSAKKRRQIEYYTAEDVRDILLDSDYEIEEHSLSDSDEDDSDWSMDSAPPSPQPTTVDDADPVPSAAAPDPAPTSPAPETTPDRVQDAADRAQQAEMWRRLDSDETFEPTTRRSAVRPTVPFDAADLEPIDFFYKFYPKSIFAHIAQETNRFAAQYFDNPDPLPGASRFRDWNDTDEGEMRAFTALQLGMGIVTKASIPNYWEKQCFVISTPGFGEVMPRNRYQVLNSFLHFNNNDNQVARGEPGFDPLFKVRPLIDSSLPTYKEEFSPGAQLSVDESLAPFKGRISYKQYIPNKPKKWGIKMWVLCDAKTGFCLEWIPYTGHVAAPAGSTDSVTERIVKRLVEPYYQTNRTVYMDNYYTSIPLFRELKREGLGACGTIRQNRRGLPDDIRSGRLRLNRDDDPAYFVQDELLAVTWHDTKRVHVISTVDDNTTIEKRVRSRHHEGGHRSVKKPSAVANYNKYMNGVDKLDQKMSYYRFPHRKVKAYRVLYHFLLEVAVVNAQIAHRIANPTSKMSSRNFRIAVVMGLLSGHNTERYRQSPSPPIPEPARLTERHFLQERDDNRRPDCIVCSDRSRGIRKQPKTKCEQCDKAMCIPCFKRFHTLKKYRY